MGGAGSTPRGGGGGGKNEIEVCLELLVGSKGYSLGSPFWHELFGLPVRHEWAEEKVNEACRSLARNNRYTGHLVKLLIHLVWSLQEISLGQNGGDGGVGVRGGEGGSGSSTTFVPVKATNAAHFSRIFLKYFIEVYNADVVDHLLLSDVDADVSDIRKGDENVLDLVVRSLLGFVGISPVNSSTYLLHLEILNLLLVMMSTQLYPSIDGLPKPYHPFLEAAMMQEIELAAPFIRKLLISYTARLPAPSIGILAASSPVGGQNQVGILRRVSSAAASVFLLPYYSYAYLVNSGGEAVKSPLAENSLLLLLVLVHNGSISSNIDAMDEGGANGGQEIHAKSARESFNPFREALETLRDMDFSRLLREGSSGGGGGDLDGIDVELDGDGGNQYRIPYGALYERLGACIGDDRSTLLLYSLVHGNPTFLEYMLVRVDLDTLLLPLLEVLYNAPRCNANQIYMLLIILLILSQDSSFNASVHKLMLPGVPWYKERLLPKISLGSLMVVILIRIVKENLSKLRDVYLHTNCLATLANMAPHCHQLNSYASQCLTSLFDMLARKYTRLSETHTNGSVVYIEEREQMEQPVEEVLTELHIYTDFLRIVLEIINSILTYALPRNPEVVYALLHRQELFQPYKEHPSFQELLANIYTVIEFFSVPLNDKEIDGHWSVDRVLQVIITNMRSWRGEGMKTFTQLRFTYEEELHSEDFFTPYVWQLVVSHSGFRWNLDANHHARPPPLALLDHSEEQCDPSTPLQKSRSYSASAPMMWRPMFP